MENMVIDVQNKFNIGQIVFPINFKVRETDNRITYLEYYVRKSTKITGIRLTIRGDGIEKKYLTEYDSYSEHSLFLTREEAYREVCKNNQCSIWKHRSKDNNKECGKMKNMDINVQNKYHIGQVVFPIHFKARETDNRITYLEYYVRKSKKITGIKLTIRGDGIEKKYLTEYDSYSEHSLFLTHEEAYREVCKKNVGIPC